MEKGNLFLNTQDFQESGKKTTGKQEPNHFEKPGQIYKDIFDLSPLGIYQATTDGHFIAVNRALAEMLGYDSPEELLKVNKKDLYVNPALRSELVSKYSTLGYITEVQVLWKRKDSLHLWVELTARAIKDHNGNIRFYEGVVHDIDKKKKIEEALHESDMIYGTLVEGMSEGLIKVNNDGVIQFVNSSLCSMLGYSKDELIGVLSHHKLHPEKDAEIIRNKNRSRIGRTSDKYEVQMKKKSGELIWVEINGSQTMDLKGNVIGSIAVITNIDQRKHSEDEIKKSLKEKEVLIKEIHHRVKNNLQIILSLLKLQSAYINDEKGLKIFRDIQNRIISIETVHQKLYQSKDVSGINFGEYAQNLLAQLFNIYRDEYSRVSFEIKCIDTLMNLDTAIPCGLILTEIVSNSLKHAFPGNMSGRIIVELKKYSETQFILSVKDNGIGLSNVDINNTDTLGLQLVKTLTRQLDGKIYMKTKSGTEFIIIFTAIEYKERI